MIALVLWPIAGVVIGVWRIKVFFRLLDAKYPNTTPGTIGVGDVPILVVWALMWPVALVADVIDNHTRFKEKRT